MEGGSRGGGCAAGDQLKHLALEVTTRCQLDCSHCYSSSGAHRDHGSMTAGEWGRVIDEARALGAQRVQLIGGEPTLHPDLANLVAQCLARNLRVEVFSNLARVTTEMWGVFEHPGVSLATSYYSAEAAQHDTITRRRSHRPTVANLREALRRGIPVRVGVVHMNDDQDVEGAVAELKDLGVRTVRIDRLRHVGRAALVRSGLGELCGRCADARIAVACDGAVWPCPMARWIVYGNVREATLAEIMDRSCAIRRRLAKAFARRGSVVGCVPDDSGGGGGCGPDNAER